MTRRWILTLFLCASLSCHLVPLTLADEPELKTETPSERETAFEFEDGVVEGAVGTRGNLSSLATSLNQDRRSIYSRSLSFERSLKKTVREMRYAQ